jgi:hypothetical protein
MCRSFLIWWSPNWQFFLFAEQLKFYSENNFLLLYYQEFSCICFKVLGFTVKSLIHLNWFLYKLRNKGLVSVFYMYITSVSSTICWRDCLNPSVSFGLLCPKSDGCICVCLFLGLLCCSIGLPVYVLAPCCFCCYTSVV